MLKKTLLRIIRMYQTLVSPFWGGHCRFTPTCSGYCLLAIEKHGVLKGLTFSFWRVLRCHPFSKGGIDVP